MVQQTLFRNRLESPFDMLYDLRREMDRVFEGLTSEPRYVVGGWALPTDILETADEVRCMIEVPGLRPEDLDVRMENNVLTISGEKKPWTEGEEREAGFRLNERRYGRFERSFVLPQTVNADQVRANYENGVLIVTLPKAEEARPRRIQIEGGTEARRIEAGTTS